MLTAKPVLIVSAVLFAIGLYGTLSRRNVIGVLMSIEILFNAAALNFVAFNRYMYPDAVWGQGVVLFVIALAAAEAVLGLALVLAMARVSKTVLLEKIDLLKG
jgi:NADH:ubiquinone oxidoreductase subunit K